MLEDFTSAFSFLKYLFVHEKVSVVIPCFNEENTVASVVSACKRSPIVGEIIVVDDGSVDSSVQKAKHAGARVVLHRKNKGKGEALLSGAKAAKFPVLVFLDADFRNASQEALEAIALPVLRHESNMCKATFGRDAGRVTELAAKPLLGFLFSEVSLTQPLSGQFAIRKALLEKLEVQRDWGIDVSIVLECIKRGEKILEVNIGELEHKHRPLHELAHTSRQVMKAILQQAGFHAQQHKLIVFDIEGVLVPQGACMGLARPCGISRQLAPFQKRLRSGKIPERKFLRLFAAALSRRPSSCLSDFSPKTLPYSLETLVYLKRMGYKLAVVSFSPMQALCRFPPSLFDDAICPSFVQKAGHFSGEIFFPPFRGAGVFSKEKAIRFLLRKYKIRKGQAIAVGSKNSGREFFAQAGTALSFSPLPNVRRISSLPELLIIAS